MSLLSLETSEEMLAIKQINQNYSSIIMQVHLQVNHFKYLLAELRHVGNHWTSGNQLECLWRPQWCDSDEKLYRNSSMWLVL